MRLVFTKEGALRYIGHLDVVRMWERAFRRAKLPLAYTLGFTPHPRLTLAAPLALGVTSEGELMDVYLREALPAEEVAARVGAQLPTGCRVVSAAALPVDGPAISALVRWTQYRVPASGGTVGQASPSEMGSRWAGGPGAGQEAARTLDQSEVPWRPADERLAPPEPEQPLPSEEDVEARIENFMSAASVPLARARDGKTVDVLAGVLSLGLGESSAPDRVCLEMVLKLDSSGAGRPEDVTAALGLRARSIHRVKIGLEGEPPPAGN